MAASEVASPGLEAENRPKPAHLALWGLANHVFPFPLQACRDAGASAGSAPGRAAPGRGNAARSAPAASHLVNAINNVISAPHTSFSQAGGERARLQLEIGPEIPIYEHPKTQSRVAGTQPYPRSGCHGAAGRGTSVAMGWNTAHSNSGLLSH